MDNLASHRTENIRQWGHDIELFYMPPYAPQINPNELDNRDLKPELSMGLGSSDRGTFRHVAQRFMEALGNMPQRLRVYFENVQVLYAS